MTKRGRQACVTPGSVVHVPPAAVNASILLCRQVAPRSRHMDPANIPYGGSTALNWNGPEGPTYTIQCLSITPGVTYPAVLINSSTELTIFDAGSMAIGPSTTFNGTINGVAVAPDGSRIYVGLPYSSNISAFVAGGLVTE
jgi:hypothetical protein